MARNASKAALLIERFPPDPLPRKAIGEIKRFILRFHNVCFYKVAV